MRNLKRLPAWAFILTIPFLAGGCLSSEGDYKQLVEEKDALAGELEAAKQENGILTRAQADVYQERDRLVRLTEAWTASNAPAQPGLAPAAGEGAGAAAGAGAEPIPAGGAYTAVAGDTLSKIAARFNTTPQVLRQLNPPVDARRGEVWAGEQIKLPVQP